MTEPICGRLYELVQKIADEKGFAVSACRVGEADHVHCFVSAPPGLSVTAIVKYLKGISGNVLLREFPELRQQLWKGPLWNGSYFCETIGSTSVGHFLRTVHTCYPFLFSAPAFALV